MKTNRVNTIQKKICAAISIDFFMGVNL